MQQKITTLDSKNKLLIHPVKKVPFICSTHLLPDSVPNLRLFFSWCTFAAQSRPRHAFFFNENVCFSSPQPRLNNRRAINYIPNWIPICPFAMYGSKTFYLLSPFKVPQDPSVLRKNIYFCPSCNSYLPSTEFQLSSNSRWVWLKINFIIVIFFNH